MTLPWATAKQLQATFHHPRPLLLLLLFFLKWTILEVFIEFITIFLLFYVLGFLASRHVGSQLLTRDRTGTPCVRRQSLKHWTTREVPVTYFFT